MTKALITRRAPYLEQDSDFFQRHPTRRHYIRYMSVAELAAWQAEGVCLPPLPQGFAWYTVVRQETDGFRSRRFFSYAADAGDGAPEEAARQIYDMCAGDPSTDRAIAEAKAVVRRGGLA